MKELVSKLRKYEIRIRKAINSQMQGNYHSVFKGSGLEFDDVRLYQYGDDIRHIDWHASAKGHGAYIKTFKEEKEQNVFFILDVSASQKIGKPNSQKLDIAKEICGVLSLSAIREDSSVGVVCYSDQKEKYIKPGKGIKHAYEIINDIFKLEPSSTKTNLSKAMGMALSMIKRKSLIVVISDFIDEGYERNLKSIARKHDLVVVHISDERETKFPKVGIVPLYDKESGRTIWVNTSSSEFKGVLDKYYEGNRTELKNLCIRNNSSYVHINTQEDYVPKLIRLFKFRNKIRK
ncbi:DUF58 domain-containing protein [Sediminitomix flava]|uniref:Uncharacterized protein DUF58 n=1 Tax=Sediminitomix flava TaxID=379075 RepID=A0A315ZH95_SEDFL|nr:DUF58 domain-containing protein [Sediminitomix flava]PWJ44662.1 uncharacterized protein DUF58 [Sediminitomix flava]